MGIKQRGISARILLFPLPLIGFRSALCFISSRCPLRFTLPLSLPLPSPQPPLMVRRGAILLDCYDVPSTHTIAGMCSVHLLRNYTKLENIGAEDYFCHFEYKAAVGAFTPDHVAMCCKCEVSYNPNDLMVQCEGCKDW